LRSDPRSSTIERSYFEITFQFIGPSANSLARWTLLAEGIRSVSTASHGGIKLSAERNAQMPDYMRNEDGWYEEDSEWAKVAVVFPDAFGADVVTAYGTLRNWEPDAYEKFTGQALKPGDSYIRDQQMFRREHANTLIARGDDLRLEKDALSDDERLSF
jgi:hypothetical protein